MSDSVFRSGRKQSFTVLYNSMLRDRRLSLKAKGLFAIMMSLPDDWQFSISGLASYTGYGKDIIRAAMLELKEVGYLVQEQVHGDGGRFGGSVYVLQDEAPPCSENPVTVEPCSGFPFTANPTQQKKDLTKERQTKPPISPKGDAGGAKKKKRGGLETAPEVWAAARAYAGEDPELLAAMTDFLRCRELRKNPMLTVRSFSTLTAKLGRLAPDRAMKVMLLDYATSHNWDSVYPMKEDELPEKAAGAEDRPPEDQEGIDGI
ncbi:helix-turn-helix domain-containing protein [Dysosmobacter sp.]|uniref:helix-turn-helix domain-containing protein n=1 Tax=Dysosmobacter sp. TaxID=2591382 RepID=UPI003A95D62B